jgi:hypothetical protein
MDTIAIGWIKQNIFTMPITQTKNIADYRHHSRCTTIIETTIIPVSDGKQNIVKFYTRWHKRDCILRTNHAFSFLCLGKKFLLIFTQFYPIAWVCCYVLIIPQWKFLKNYHEVGVGNVLRYHSWNIGGYLEKV